MLEVEAKRRRVLTAATRVGELADDRAEGSHEARVARVDAVGKLVPSLEKVDSDAGLAIRLDHLGVLAQRQLAVEAPALAQRLALTSALYCAFSSPSQRKQSAEPSRTSRRTPYSEVIPQRSSRGVPPRSSLVRSAASTAVALTGPPSSPRP